MYLFCSYLFTVLSTGEYQGGIAQVAETIQDKAAAPPRRPFSPPRRALAYATAGELDHACELTHQLLPEARVVASATIRIDLHRLARALGRWPRHHAVLQLQPHLDSALAGGRQFT